MCCGMYLVLNSNTLSDDVGGPISFRGQVTVSRSDYFSSRSHHFVQTTFVSSSKSISFMWVHKRTLMIDKQIEHAVDYFSKA